MVQICRDKGLRADAADAVTFLRAQPDRSLGGLFAAQVVEHLEPSYLAALLDAAFDTLRPGAPIVLETINPACWFAFFESYIRDITHVRPLHPDTLEYLLLATGFQRLDIRYRVALSRTREASADPAACRARGLGRNVERERREDQQPSVHLPRLRRDRLPAVNNDFHHFSQPGPRRPTPEPIRPDSPSASRRVRSRRTVASGFSRKRNDLRPACRRRGAGPRDRGRRGRARDRRPGVAQRDCPVRHDDVEAGGGTDGGGCPGPGRRAVRALPVAYGRALCVGRSLRLAAARVAAARARGMAARRRGSGPVVRRVRRDVVAGAHHRQRRRRPDHVAAVAAAERRPARTTWSSRCPRPRRGPSSSWWPGLACSSLLRPACARSAMLHRGSRGRSSRR